MNFGALILLIGGMVMLVLASANPRNITRTWWQRLLFAGMGAAAQIVALLVASGVL